MSNPQQINSRGQPIPRMLANTAAKIKQKAEAWPEPQMPRYVRAVWTALGCPKYYVLGEPGSYRWICDATITPNMVAGLAPFCRARNGDQVTKRFRMKIIKEYAAAYLRGTWIPLSDPIIYTESGFAAQGNHRIFAVAKAGETDPNIAVRFLVVLGVPDISERRLGRVYGWDKSDRMGEKDKTEVAVAGLGAAREYGVKSVTGDQLPDVALYLALVRNDLERVLELIGNSNDGSRRAGVVLALTEGMLVDKAQTGNCNRVEIFINVLRGKSTQNNPWALDLLRYLTDRKGESGSEISRQRDYHSTVLLLKRWLLQVQWKVDQKGHKPDKESLAAEWHGMSAGADLGRVLRGEFIKRLAMLSISDPELFMNIGQIFEREIQEAARYKEQHKLEPEEPAEPPMLP